MELIHHDSSKLEQEIHVTLPNDSGMPFLIHIPIEASGDHHQESIEISAHHLKEEHLLQSIPAGGSIELEVTESKTIARKRTSLTIEKKLEIIQRHEKGETQRSLSLEYQVGRTTISDILKRKYKFFKFMANQTDKDSDNLKRRRTLRRTVHKLLEEKLLEWYNENRQQGLHISGPMISARAQELHKELGYSDNFTASNGWLDRFKIRNGIKLCGLREVKSESDVTAVAPFKAELESLAQWYNLTLEQVYNADETDLFWKMLPNPDADSNEVKASVRAYRERMTVLACANATGTHKLPLVCVGRGKRSRTFTSTEVKTLPVQYYSQETAWVDHEIFRNWFHTQFVPTTRHHLRYMGLPETALLLIDRSPSHPSDQFLRSEDGFFFVQYFPAKVKCLIQPMEQGIIRDMKRHYRRELLTELIQKNSTISEFHKNLTIKDAIRGIAHGWESISEETIRRCFTKLFPGPEAVPLEFNAVETTINLDSFAKLIKNIPECSEYSIDRLEKWLNCDEAEPKRNEKAGSKVKPEENIVFVDVQTTNINQIQPLTVEVPVVQNQNIDSDEEIEDDDEIINDADLTASVSNQQQVDTYVQEESGEVSCRQAFDALNVLLKFMKSDAESRYKDVVLLQELKKKFKKKLNDSANIKQEF